MLYLSLMILAILCTFGVCELIHLIGRLFLKRAELSSQILVLPLKGDVRQLEFTVKQIQHQNRWNTCTPYQIFLIDQGISQETQQLISILQEDIDGITLCTEENFPALLRQNLRLQTSAK